jgi:hypothetical protein
VENGFQVITFARIFAVEKFHKLQAELLVHIFLRNFGIDFPRHNKPQEELIHHLKMRPTGFQHRFIFFWVKIFGL